MALQVINMVLPVLVMIAIGCLCNKKQIFNMEGLQGLKAVIGNVMLPVVLFNAFLKAEYNLRVLVVFLVVFAGFGAAILKLRTVKNAKKPYPGTGNVVRRGVAFLRVIPIQGLRSDAMKPFSPDAVRSPATTVSPHRYRLASTVPS